MKRDRNRAGGIAHPAIAAGISMPECGNEFNIN